MILEWKRVDEEIPPIGQDILLGTFIYGVPPKFEWWISRIYRAYNDDKKYNPDYYEYSQIVKISENVGYTTQWNQLQGNHRWAIVPLLEYTNEVSPSKS